MCIENDDNYDPNLDPRKTWLKVIILQATGFVVVVGACCWLALHFTSEPDPPKAEITMVWNAEVMLPSPTEFQGWINDILKKAKKPTIKVDGQIGAETIKAYEAAFCYQQGIKYMHKTSDVPEVSDGRI